MRILFLSLIVLFALTGCTVTGALLGAAVDKITGEDKYTAQYAAQGLEADILLSSGKDVEIVKNRPKEQSKSKEKYIDNVKHTNTK